MPVNGGEPRVIPGLKRGQEVIAFSPDSRFAYVQILDSLPARVDRLELATDQAIAACGGDARDAVMPR